MKNRLFGAKCCLFLFRQIKAQLSMYDTLHKCDVRCIARRCFRHFIQILRLCYRVSWTGSSKFNRSSSSRSMPFATTAKSTITLPSSARWSVACQTWRTSSSYRLSQRMGWTSTFLPSLTGKASGHPALPWTRIKS